jgi:hypothetical protein
MSIWPHLYSQTHHRDPDQFLLPHVREVHDGFPELCVIFSVAARNAVRQDAFIPLPEEVPQVSLPGRVVSRALFVACLTQDREGFVQAVFDEPGACRRANDGRLP